jgi:two-component system copper resistance phosphate regulon response regulator CusR
VPAWCPSPRFVSGTPVHPSREQSPVKILIVEDERKLSHVLRRALESEGHIAHQAYSGPEGLTLAVANSYDAILLDISLPMLDGWEVCSRLRGRGSSTPIIMLTARGEVEDRVRGLDSGADDYLLKPFALPELLARLRAVLRRESGSHSPVLSVGDLELDTVRRHVCRGGRTIALSTREYTMLEYFMRHSEQVLTRQMIAEHVWDFNFDPGSNVIDVYVSYLRRKIDDGSDLKLLHTLRGAGYKLSAGG